MAQILVNSKKNYYNWINVTKIFFKDDWVRQKKLDIFLHGYGFTETGMQFT